MSAPPSPRPGGGPSAASRPDRPLDLYERPFPLHGALVVVYAAGFLLWVGLVAWALLDPPAGPADGRAVLAAVLVLAALIHLAAAPAAIHQHDDAGRSE